MIPIGKKKQLHKLSGVLLTAGSALALAGCGGSGSTTSGGASFVTQASAICTQINQQVKKLPAITGQASLLSTGKQEISLSTTAIGKLKALSPASDKQATFTAYVSGLDHETALLGRVLTAIKSNDRAAVTQLAHQADKIGASIKANAKTLGLASCAADSSPQGRN